MSIPFLQDWSVTPLIILRNMLAGHATNFSNFLEGVSKPLQSGYSEVKLKITTRLRKVGTGQLSSDQLS